MQNKGFVKVFAVLLTLVCLYYLSFTFVTRHYEGKAKEYANGDLKAESHYLDSLATEVVYPVFGYTLNECREREIGLGLDLKGGMNVILEVDAAAVLRSLGNEDDPQFIKALEEASADNRKGNSNKDIVSLFIEKYEAINKNSRLANVFSSKVADISSTDDNDKVRKVLEDELKDVTDNSVNVLRTRIDAFGVVAPNIQKIQNRSDRILIELPGIKEPERVKKLLQGSANLEFWRTYGYGEAQQYLLNLDQKSAEMLALHNPANDSVKTDTVQVVQKGDLGFDKSFTSYFAKPEQFSDPQEYAIGGAAVALVHKNDTAKVNTIINKYPDQYPSDMKFYWGFKPTDKKEAYYQLYTLKASLKADGYDDNKGVRTKKGPALDGDVIVSAKADQITNRFGGASSDWGVSMQMNPNGARSWATITESEANKKNDPNIGQAGAIAIVLDGYVYSAPKVENKIEGGNSQITGNFTIQEAKDLENVLKSGKMKASVRIIQEDIVGPSLGQEAISSGVISFIIALIVLMFYMCIAYGLIPGMIANGALLLNLFFTMGVLASFHAVMTLPGIAGLVLTLAMAVDANVLIYERTREELRAGKNVRSAVLDGYKHAFSAIFDANLTSIITAAILIYYGSGPIRGFATTLIIGISASFFTAVFMTRLVYEWGFSKGKFQNLQFCTAVTKNLLINTKINFLGLSKKAIALSLAIAVLGIASIFTLGLNRGIDFTGGRNYVVRFDQPVNTSDMEEALTPVFDGAIVRVITIGSSNQVRITTNYKMENNNDDVVELEIRDKLSTALKNYMTDGTSINEHIQSSQKVEASMAKDMQVSASFAVLAAIVCMALYIFIRFRDVAFSVGTFAAVAHDAAIVIFFYSFLYKIMPFSMEIDQTFIAAILTVVGYSINDKVVIFDRVREFRKLYPKRDSFSIMNESLNTTLTRTINTTFSSMLVVFCIFLLGGDTIRSFTFALFIGIFLGSYSSVFIATPIAYHMLKKKDKNKDEK